MSTLRKAVPLLAALLGVAVGATAVEAVASEASFGRLVDPAASFGCTLSHGKLVCGDLKGNKHKGSQGERSCPPGYVVLDKPNKYGAFCEPKGGFPAQEGGAGDERIEDNPCFGLCSNQC